MLVLFCLSFLVSDQEKTFIIQLVGSPESYVGFQLMGDEAHDFPESGLLNINIKNPEASFEILGPEGRTYFVAIWNQFWNQALDQGGAGEPLEIDVSLPHVAMYQLVTANRSKQVLLESPAEVSILKFGDHPEQQTAMTTDKLKGHHQVHLQKTNLGGGSPIIRGMSGNRILYLIDGFKVNNGTFRLGLNQYLNTVPTEMMDQMEILGGPSGVQYGSDGLGGTIQLLTRNPLSDGSDFLGYNQFISTADGTHTETLYFKHTQDTLSFNGHFKNSALHDLRAGSPVGVQDPTGFDQWDGSLSMGLKMNENQRLLFLNLASSASDVPRTDRIWSGKDLLWNYDPQTYRLHALKWKNDHSTRTWDSMELGIAWSRQEEGQNRISARTPNLLEKNFSQVDTVQGFASFTRFFQNHHIVYGLDFQSDGVNSQASVYDLEQTRTTSAIPKFPNDSSYSQAGAFGIGTLGIGSHFKVRAGLRYASTNLSGTLPEPFLYQKNEFQHISPVFSVAYQKEKHFLSFSANNGFRSPNLEDSFSLGFSNKGFDAPNPDLKPETTWNYDLMYRYHTQRRFIQISAFYAFYEDLIERVTGTFNGQGEYQGEEVFILDNVGLAEINGFSISLNQKIGRNWDLLAAAAYTRGTQTERNEPMTRIPPFKLQFELKKRLDLMNINLKMNYAGKQDRLSPDDLNDSRIPEGGTPSYFVVHLQSSWEISPLLRFSASIENLGDVLYKTHGSGIYEAGRRIVLSFQAKNIAK